MPELQPDESLGKPDDRIHKCPPSAERANIRSATPRGFSRAVFMANRPPAPANDNTPPPASGEWLEIPAFLRRGD